MRTPHNTIVKIPTNALREDYIPQSLQGGAASQSPDDQLFCLLCGSREERQKAAHENRSVRVIMRVTYFGKWPSAQSQRTSRLSSH